MTDTLPDMGVQADLARLTSEYSAHNYDPLPVVVASADGVWVTDVGGHRYLDMLAGYSSLNFGHRHPRLVAAAERQLGRVTMVSRAFDHDQFGPFCAELAELCGMDTARRSGADRNPAPGMPIPRGKSWRGGGSWLPGGRGRRAGRCRGGTRTRSPPPSRTTSTRRRRCARWPRSRTTPGSPTGSSSRRSRRPTGCSGWTWRVMSGGTSPAPLGPIAQ